MNLISSRNMVLIYFDTVYLFIIFFHNVLFLQNWKLISTFIQTKSTKWIYYIVSLYKTKKETMDRDVRNFIDNNNVKSWYWLVPLIHKSGWQERHMFQKKKETINNSAAPIIIIVDSIVAGLREWGHVWRNYFKDALNVGISDNRIKNVLWKARDISLPHATAFLIRHRDTKINQKVFKVES